MATTPVKLLLTSTDVRGDGVGELFLRSLIDGAEHLQVRVMQVRELAAFSLPGILGRVVASILNRLPLIQSLMVSLYRVYGLKRDLRRVEAHVDCFGARDLWITLSSVELILLADKLQASGRYRLLLTVWDAPELLLEHRRVYGRVEKSVLTSFYSALRGAQKISVVSDAMKQRYAAFVRREPIVLKHGINSLPCNSAERRSKTMRIVFAGSLYSKQEWNALIAALESVGWEVNGRKAVVYFVGHFPTIGASRAARVRMLGRKSFNETMDIIAKADVGYLPYWFSGQHELAARTSFPGKLSAYVSCGVPVLHHAPSYTDVASFLRSYPVGVLCPSHAAHHLIDALTSLDGYKNSAKFRLAVVAAMRDELSRDTMAKRFTDFISLSDA